MRDFIRRSLTPALAAIVLMVGVVGLTLLASPLAGLALLSLVVGFVTRIVCQSNHYHHEP